MTPTGEPPGTSAGSAQAIPRARGRYLALVTGVIAVSSAAILITLARAQGAPAILIAALRMAAAALVIAPIALLRCRVEIRTLRARELLLGIASGICLALHFAFWISSLDYTSVMSSVVFVSTNPLFVGAASLLILKERLGRATLVGALVAVAGGVVVGLADLGANIFVAHEVDGTPRAGAIGVSPR